MTGVETSEVDEVTPGATARGPEAGTVLTVGMVSALVAVIVTGLWGLPGLLPGFDLPPTSRQTQTVLAVSAAVSVTAWAFSRARARAVAIVGLVLAVAANGAAGYLVSQLQDSPSTLLGRDAATGRLLWQRHIPYASVSLESLDSKATVTEQRGPSCPQFYVSEQVSAATGRLSHARRVPNGGFRNDIVVDDGNIEVRDSSRGLNSGIEATDRVTKLLRWRRDGTLATGPSGPGLTEHPVIGDGVLMVAVGGGYVGRDGPRSSLDFVEATTGRDLWRIRAPDAEPDPLLVRPVFADGLVYVLRGSGLAAFDVRSGALSWRLDTPPATGPTSRSALASLSASGTRVAVFAGGTVVVGDANGRRLWQARVEGTAQMHDAVVAGPSVLLVTQGTPRIVCHS